MDFPEAVGSVLSKYATFDGRARRAELWFWWLALLVVGAIFAGLGWFFGSGVFGTIVAIGYTIFWLATILPTLAVGVRRLHDTSRSGWWILTYFIPIIGLFIILVFALLPSTPGPNQYGPEPA